MKKNFLLLILLLSLIISGLGLIAALTSVRQRQIVQKKAAEEKNASLSLPSSMKAIVNQEISMPIMVNTDGTTIIGVDVVLNFDKNYLTLIEVIPGTAFETYLPADVNGYFNESTVKKTANLSGKIKIGAAAFNWKTEQTTQGFNGTTTLFTLKFKTKKAGQTSVHFVYSPNSTTDSNLVSISGNQAQDILSNTTNLSLTITSPTPTQKPTPTPTKKPTPTSTPTPTKKPTPTSTPISTSTSTPTPTLTPTPKPTSTSTPPPTSTSSPQCKNNGDINLDGKVSELDIMALLINWSPSGPVPTPLPGQCSTDLNNDGKVSELDIMKLLLNWNP